MSNYTKSTNFATKDNLTPGDPLKVVRGTEIDTEYNNIATAIATKTDNSAAAITGGSITGITDLAVADGGTGASTAAGALNNLLPSQTSAANKYLQSDGTNASWDAVTLSTADITGTLPVANGGTGVTSSTGTGNVVLSNSPTLVTPALGTPASGTLTNATGLPISTGVSGLGTGVATFLGTPSSANLASAVTDETGSGALVFANSPTLVTPALGTPSALVGTNITGTASGLTAGNVTTNANLTGAVTSVGNATSLGSFSSSNLAGALTDETGSGSAVFATSPTLVTPILGTPTSATLTNATGLPISTGVSGLGTGVATFLSTPSSANLAAALTDETGTGSAVFATSPTLVTPVLGTPASATLTNATGLPISTGVSGLGTGIATALAVNVGSSGAPLVNGGVLGTPSSGTATNLTGLPLTTGVTGTLPTANGGTNLTSFTSGGVVYASSSSALATGSALTFDGAKLTVTGATQSAYLVLNAPTDGGYVSLQAGGTTFADFGSFKGINGTGSATDFYLGSRSTNNLIFGINFTEQMRLTSTGLGIGTSSPTAKLELYSTADANFGEKIYHYSSSLATNRFPQLEFSQTPVAQSYENKVILRQQNSPSGNYPSLAIITNSAGAGEVTRMFLDGFTGNVGLGVTPSAWGSTYKAMQIGSAGISMLGGTAGVGSFGVFGQNFYYDGTNYRYTTTNTANYMLMVGGVTSWHTAASGTAGTVASFTQAMTLSAAGYLGIGVTSPSGNLHVGYEGSTGISVARFEGSRGTADNLDVVTMPFWNVANGVGDKQIATIGVLTGTSSNQTQKGQIYFSTSDGTLTERARIDSSGRLLVAKTANNIATVGFETDQTGETNVTVSASECMNINRNTNDGDLVRFRQDNTVEGSISVSGTTVSYNGGHLSRWAQTTTAKDESIVKGTVLSNLDAMNVYTDAEGNPVTNEQLNKVKVSDTEGDVNVAGVFVNWTFDDQHNVDEINMAMTGDMIIRIAQGTTVVRGDLLMSAGDGTAKPQGDDIVRSKTVAKVTSNHITCTYADGSYCVPCVLMAC